MSTVTVNNSTWETPRTWLPDDTLIATDYNDEFRDELLALKTPASGIAVIDESADYSTSSTSFADIDSTDMSITVETGGGAVKVFLTGMCTLVIGNAAAHRALFDVMVDGVRQGGDDGYTGFGWSTTVTMTVPLAICIPITGLSAGSHTFKVQWRTTNAANTITLYAGAGTSNNDTHPRFWLEE